MILSLTTRNYKYSCSNTCHRWMMGTVYIGQYLEIFVFKKYLQMVKVIQLIWNELKNYLYLVRKMTNLNFTQYIFTLACQSSKPGQNEILCQKHFNSIPWDYKQKPGHCKLIHLFWLLTKINPKSSFIISRTIQLWFIVGHNCLLLLHVS